MYQRRVGKIQIIALVLAGLAATLIAIVAMQPSSFHIARTAAISAPASVLFAQVNEFRNWQAWSPWESIDPAMKRVCAGATSGTGAVYLWAGNNQIGEGRMTITEGRPSDLIRIKLEFLKPFAATHTAEFVFKPDGDHTAVTWSMTGTNNFVAKGIGLLINMDKMIGSEFEKGPEQLANVVEAAAPER